MKTPVLSAIAFFGTLAALSVGYAALNGGLSASDKVSSNAGLSSASWNRIVDGILDLDARTNGISSVNGNIGIGVASPGKALDVQGSLRVSSGHIITNNPNGGIVLNAWPADSSASGIWFRSNTQLWEETAYANLMRITGSGNVGIGTVAPGQKLSVAGTVESTSGGFKFPDGSVQATAATGGWAMLFWGLYQTSNAGCKQNNPITGSTSCPSWYTATIIYWVMGPNTCTWGNDQTWLYLCWKATP